MRTFPPGERAVSCGPSFLCNLNVYAPKLLQYYRHEVLLKGQRYSSYIYESKPLVWWCTRGAHSDGHTTLVVSWRLAIAGDNRCGHGSGCVGWLDEYLHSHRICSRGNNLLIWITDARVSMASFKFEHVSTTLGFGLQPEHSWHLRECYQASLTIKSQHMS